MAVESDQATFEAWLQAEVTGSFRPAAGRLESLRYVVLAAASSTRAQGSPAHQSQRRLIRRGGRRWITGLAAALLATTATVGIVAAETGPGEPFYPLRLSIESLTLPAAGTPARFAAEVALLRARINEARDAGARGDTNGALAALDAYDTRLNEVIGDAISPTIDDATLTDVLVQDEGVLTQLLTELPPAADPGLQRALDQITRARAQLPGTAPDDQGAPGQQTGGAQGPPAASARPGPGQGNAKPDPSASHRPSPVSPAPAGPGTPAAGAGSRRASHRSLTSMIFVCH
jgi:hypothetical protein